MLGRAAGRVAFPDAETWGLGRDESGGLSIGSIDVVDLVESYGSPIHVVDLDRLDEMLDVHAIGSAGVSMMATHRSVHVAGLVTRVAEAGWAIWSSSPYELQATLDAGVAPAQVVHSPRVWTDDDVALASDAQVGIACVSSRHDLERLAPAVTTLADTGGATRLGIAVDVAVDTAASFDDPTGIDVAVARFDEMLAAAAAASLAPDHLHLRLADRRIGTDEVDRVADLVVAFLHRVADRSTPRSVAVSVDLRAPTVRRLDPVRARLNRSLAVPLPAFSPGESVHAAVRRFRRRLASAGHTDLEIVFDPGTAATASAQFTLATVLDIDRGATVEHVVLDAGMNLADDTLVEYHELVTARTGDAAAPLRSYRFVGPICTPADVLFANCWLPEVRVGDVMAMMDTGGGYVASSTFFSFPRPAVVGVSRSDGSRLLRRAERFDDLVALDRR